MQWYLCTRIDGKGDLQSWFYYFETFQRFSAVLIQNNDIASNITNFAHELPDEFPKVLRLRELESIRKISNVGGDSLRFRTKN